jgi:predicted TIM-barrel fold metal-dependent hydrolase
VPIVIDHFGLADAAAGTNQAGFSTLCDLLAEGRYWVKLSAAYRISKNEPDFSDATPIAKAFIAANPDRVVWGRATPTAAGVPLARTEAYCTALRETRPPRSQPPPSP